MKSALKLSRIFGVGMVAATLASESARADQFHYNNLTVGTRAVGMGGAFTGVADDASGVYYNPAGVAFALSNDISGSANAFYSKKSVYEKTLCGDDFQEKSSGSVAPFFGGLQKLDRFVEGLVFAFGVYTTDSDLKDQDDLIENKVCNNVQIERYHRTSNARASTSYAGGVVGKRIGSNVAWGAGLTYYNSDELVQEFQNVVQTIGTNTDGTPLWRYRMSNVREHLLVYGVQPVFGVQAALPANIALGLTVKKGIVASQNLEVDSETISTSFTNDQKIGVDSGSGIGKLAKNYTSVKSDKPIGSMPAEVRLGLAWFASPTFLVDFDVQYVTAVKDAPVLKDKNGIESFGPNAKYEKEAVTNLALGIEWYIMPAFPLRAGVFTNNDARPKVEKGDYNKAVATKTCADPTFRKKFCGQPDHIDYLGETLFIAYVQPNTQLSAGLVLQQGKGLSQKLGDHNVQDVKASSSTFAFSVTQNL